MKLIILFVVVVGAVLVWWLRRVKPKPRAPAYAFQSLSSLLSGRGPKRSGTELTLPWLLSTGAGLVAARAINDRRETLICH